MVYRQFWVFHELFKYFYPNLCRSKTLWIFLNKNETDIFLQRFSFFHIWQTYSSSKNVLWLGQIGETGRGRGKSTSKVNFKAAHEFTTKLYKVKKVLLYLSQCQRFFFLQLSNSILHSSRILTKQRTNHKKPSKESSSLSKHYIIEWHVLTQPQFLGKNLFLYISAGYVTDNADIFGWFFYQILNISMEILLIIKSIQSIKIYEKYYT